MTVVRVPRDGYALAALETGRGAGAPAVLLLNSLGAAMSMWDHQRAYLGAMHRVIGYDTRGHGRSDHPPGPYSFDDLVADAFAVMDHFGIRSATIMGLSLGGMTALGMGLAEPDRCKRIICCAARADAPEPFVRSWDERVAAIHKGGMGAIWPGTLERWLTPDARAAQPGTVGRLQADFLATSVTGYAGCAAALQRLDYLRHLGGLTVPTLYISGAEDVGAPPEAMQAMAAATPGAEYACIPEAAHIVNINAPAAFDSAVNDFLHG